MSTRNCWRLIEYGGVYHIHACCAVSTWKLPHSKGLFATRCLAQVLNGLAFAPFGPVLAVASKKGVHVVHLESPARKPGVHWQVCDPHPHPHSHTYTRARLQRTLPLSCPCFYSLLLANHMAQNFHSVAFSPCGGHMWVGSAQKDHACIAVADTRDWEVTGVTQLVHAVRAHGRWLLGPCLIMDTLLPS